MGCTSVGLKIGALIKYRCYVGSRASDGPPRNEGLDGVRNLAYTLQGGYNSIMVLLMVRTSTVWVQFWCLKGSLTVYFCPPYIKDVFYLLGSLKVIDCNIAKADQMANIRPKLY